MIAPRYMLGACNTGIVGLGRMLRSPMRAPDVLDPEFGADGWTSKAALCQLIVSSEFRYNLMEIAPRAATQAELARVHSDGILQAFALTEKDDSSGEAESMATLAEVSAGCCIVAADAIMSGVVTNAYVIPDMPGHHAAADTTEGYCGFSNVAVAVRHLQSCYGVNRVAVVDWDVHHGNGTQSIFYEDPSVLTISIHQENVYPLCSGSVQETGRGAGAGRCVNVPLPAGTGHAGLLCAMEKVVIPALDLFKPDFMVVAAGYDASALDPLGRLAATSETFRKMTAMCLDLAERHCKRRLLVCHEGGYSKHYVPWCGLAVLEELSGSRSSLQDPYLDWLTSCIVVSSEVAGISAVLAVAERW